MALVIPIDDAISRKAAIDIFDDYNVSVENGDLEAYRRDRKRLCELPSAQPEIIRCKDCTKRDYCRTSTVWAVPPKDDWYCADAERRPDGVDC